MAYIINLGEETPPLLFCTVGVNCGMNVVASSKFLYDFFSDRCPIIKGKPFLLNTVTQDIPVDGKTVRMMIKGNLMSAPIRLTIEYRLEGKFTLMITYLLIRDPGDTYGLREKFDTENIVKRWFELYNGTTEADIDHYFMLAALTKEKPIV